MILLCTWRVANCCNIWWLNQISQGTWKHKDLRSWRNRKPWKHKTLEKMIIFWRTEVDRSCRWVLRRNGEICSSLSPRVSGTRLLQMSTQIKKKSWSNFQIVVMLWAGGDEGILNPLMIEYGSWPISTPDLEELKKERNMDLRWPVFWVLCSN